MIDYRAPQLLFRNAAAREEYEALAPVADSSDVSARREAEATQPAVRRVAAMRRRRNYDEAELFGWGDVAEYMLLLPFCSCVDHGDR